jgi:predicted nucleotidyltransferase
LEEVRRQQWSPQLPRRSNFIVEFRVDQDLCHWLENYFAFREELSNLYEYPIDLVASAAMKNPYFIREANCTRMLVYGA